ncbi:MAG TPA: PQQ-dependent sugar dehydrogenase [Gemmatimonadales bacterium]|nr:PQQ-dependent sugar dehydrogenase [Gemmatimonadales bacterium]
MRIKTVIAASLTVVTLAGSSAFLPPDRPFLAADSRDALVGAASVAALPPKPLCDTTLRVPAGFCAVLVAEGLSVPRQIAVAPNGDVFAASGRGGVIALRDTTGDGKADVVKTWGRDPGTGIALSGGYLYFAANATIYRWPWAAGQLEPTVNAEVIVDGLPTGGHSAKPIVVKDGALYVDIGSATNSCQENDRTARSPGRMPCTELETRAGIWRFAAGQAGQTPASGTRFATGLRNPMALAFEPTTGTLWMATHGRDQLSANWGFSDSMNAELPAEEFGPVEQGADYGWPYCFYDPLARRKVQNPEYGGDGRIVGDCASKTQPAIGFPGHWAPIGLTFYGGTSFPASYRGGAFLAFHGSWNRAPLPQAGYRVVFIPFRNGRPSADYQTFLEGASSPVRPIGLGVSGDGALYVSADAQGKVWKVTYVGR